jgi:hypothetical protein
MAMLFLNIFFVALFLFFIHRDIKVLKLAISKNKELGKIIFVMTAMIILMAAIICFNVYNIINYLA